MPKWCRGVAIWGAVGDKRGLARAIGRPRLSRITSSGAVDLFTRLVTFRWAMLSMPSVCCPAFQKMNAIPLNIYNLNPSASTPFLCGLLSPPPISYPPKSFWFQTLAKNHTTKASGSYHEPIYHRCFLPWCFLSRCS